MAITEDLKQTLLEINREPPIKVILTNEEYAILESNVAPNPIPRSNAYLNGGNSFWGVPIEAYGTPEERLKAERKAQKEGFDVYVGLSCRKVL